LTGERGAVYSPCERYRYKLWRIWDSELPTLNFLMLNPSTATELVDDPTITRCTRRAEQLGFGTLIVTNLFALRSTDPRGLKQCDDARGNSIEHASGESYGAIMEAAVEATIVVMAWGLHGRYRNRGIFIASALHTMGYTRKLRVLGWTKADKSGQRQPLHPLMIGYDTQLQNCKELL
jgi:hypothetical protein